VSFATRQSERKNWVVHLLVAVLCLTLAVQGAHVCQSGPHLKSGVQADGGSSPICPVCAIAQTLMLVVSFLLLFLMSDTASSVIPLVIVKKPSWREVSLYMRPPPAL
jgi:hypothetical protein